MDDLLAFKEIQQQHQLKREMLTDTGQSVFAASVCAWEWVFIKLSPHYHAWDMWAGAASSSLTRLGHIEVIFPGFTQHCVRREGYPVDPIALCEGGSASMNVAFEWREASRHADSLYLLYLGNRPDATSNSHNDVIMVPPPPPSLFLSLPPSWELVAHESQGRSLQWSVVYPHYTHGRTWTNPCFNFSSNKMFFVITLPPKRDWCWIIQILWLSPFFTVENEVCFLLQDVFLQHLSSYDKNTGRHDCVVFWEGKMKR